MLELENPLLIPALLGALVVLQLLVLAMLLRLSGRASTRAATTDIAAVRRAVVSVSSLRNSGTPVATSASRPKAMTVGRPKRPLDGCPLTYLKA